ncbi:pickpocket protein 19-like [Cardiocondyla obscurior]|uniref:pickpocket protein 19-like n=1 Tax=Cardiocondyla obscurior TaxID=286306 RepID=UPI0039658726
MQIKIGGIRRVRLLGEHRTMNDLESSDNSDLEFIGRRRIGRRLSCSGRHQVTAILINIEQSDSILIRTGGIKGERLLGSHRTVNDLKSSNNSNLEFIGQRRIGRRLSCFGRHQITTILINIEQSNSISIKTRGIRGVRLLERHRTVNDLESSDNSNLEFIGRRRIERQSSYPGRQSSYPGRQSSYSGRHQITTIWIDIEQSVSISAKAKNMKSGKKKFRKSTRNGKTGSRGNKSRRRKLLDAILHALNYFCTHTTLHGLRYIVDPELHIVGRFLWFIVFVISSTIASNVIYSLAFRFQAAPTSINIRSMHYETSNLPFPSVTLCPSDRVDWNRALELETRIFSNVTDKESVETFRKILGKLSMMSFGDFDDLEFLRSRNVHSLAGRTFNSLLNFVPRKGQRIAAPLTHDLVGKIIRYRTDINVTQVLREVMPRCDQLLSTCWWRNADRNCCEIFEVQKTEYGFCYSFNSEMAQAAPVNSTESRPRRASGYGDWSGVKVTIHLGNITKPPHSEEIDGVVVIINGPRVWPNSGTMVPPGSKVSVSLDCVSGYATKRVLELEEGKQPCRYDRTGEYNQETCLSLCKRYWVAKYCGCNPSFLFPANLFNDYVVHFGGDYPRDISSMICNCSPECDYNFYSAQFSNVPLHNTNDIMLDVHYLGQTSFRYKTDIVITQMDLLVSFGGIIGLFLGGSLLSAVELVYYLAVAVLSSLRRRARGRPRARSSVTHVRTVLPILDYSPLKPRAKRIPIFANYGLAELNSNRY